MGQTTENVKTKNIINGVNVDELLGTIASIKSAPIIGDFKFI